MFLNKLGKEKNTNTPIGMLYAKDGAEFVIEEIITNNSRSLSKIYEKVEYIPNRQLIIKNNGAIFEPYELVNVQLDLTKSSDTSNSALLEYLNYGTNINRLITESILDVTTMLEIINNPRYKNELTNMHLATYQNLFLSEQLLKTLSLKEKIEFYTNNVHRTKDLMKEHENNFNNCIKELLFLFLDNKDDSIIENPSPLRVAIVKTCNEFYEKNVSFKSVKDELLSILNNKKESETLRSETISIFYEAISKYKITGEGWQGKKDAAKELCDELETKNKKELELINYQIDVIKNFPI